jgi:hydroxyethylthiazole kinase
VSVSPGTTLRVLRERKPLVHQITNYVVMNETANATLALGALPVMANATDIPVVLDPVGAGATRYRTETAKQILAEVDVTVLRGNQGEVATLVGVAAEVRGVESIGTDDEPADLAQVAGRSLGLVASVTGVVDHVSDGDRSFAIANGHELLAAVTGTGCMSSAITGCFLAAKPAEPLEAAAEALAAFGVAAEDAARDARGPGSFHAGLYDGLAALDPASLDERSRIT